MSAQASSDPVATRSADLGAFAAALLDASKPVPQGLCAWNGSDPAARFAVYRNNVVHSLATVLADTFPVVRELVGDAFFGAMARLFIVDHAPASPLMHRYGAEFPAWLATFEPAAGLPFLPDLARLELARLAAFHAADTPAADSGVLMQALQRPGQLASTVLCLSPSLSTLRSAHPVVSLWSAHQLEPAQRDQRLAGIDAGAGEAALVFRVDDDAIVLEAHASDVALAARLSDGTPLGAAVAAHPDADLSRVLGLLLQHRLVAGLQGPAA